MTEKKKSEVPAAAALPYAATNADLPTIFSEPPASSVVPTGHGTVLPKRTLADAVHEAVHQLRELGLNVSEQETTLCALVLYCYWEDERKTPGGNR